MNPIDHEQRIPARRKRNRAVVAIIAAGCIALLAACGASSKAAVAGSGTTTPAPNANPAGVGAPGRGRGPAAYGLAAAISGHTVQVQDPATGQVAVTYTTTTAFTQSKTVPLSTIAVGDCVTAAASPPASTNGSTSSAPTSAPTSPATAFTAATITITPSTGSTCSIGGFGGFGGGSRPAGTARPSGFPSGFPTGGAGRRFGSFASGKVLSVTGSTIVIAANHGSTQPATTDTVTTTPATTVTATVAATSTALHVGQCVTATGSADSTGAVTATRIALSTPGPNGCTVGFGRRFGSTSTGGTNG